MKYFLFIFLGLYMIHSSHQDIGDDIISGYIAEVSGLNNYIDKSINNLSENVKIFLSILLISVLFIIFINDPYEFIIFFIGIFIGTGIGQHQKRIFKF